MKILVTGGTGLVGYGIQSMKTESYLIRNYQMDNLRNIILAFNSRI